MNNAILFSRFLSTDYSIININENKIKISISYVRDFKNVVNDFVRIQILQNNDMFTNSYVSLFAHYVTL